MFSGRQFHLKSLERLYHDDKPDLVLVYGRRRVGKSRLVTEFLRDKKHVFHFTGAEPLGGDETAAQAGNIQIRNFLSSLADRTAKPMYKKLDFDDWDDCFSLLSSELPRKDAPCCVFLDELPWMACQRLGLIRALFKAWEMEWSQRKKFMLIVCGSSVGFLEKHFIKSSLFYGRATHHIHLHPWRLAEAKSFFSGSRSNDEILELYMHFGGIPRYLELVSPKDSVRRAVSRLCLSAEGILLGEMETLFRSSFTRQSPKYRAVVMALSKSRALGYAELAARARSARGSSFKHIVDNLINADLVAKTTPFDKMKHTRLAEFHLSDEFLRFYLQFVEPHAETIKSSAGNGDLYEAILPERKRFAWKGRAFEKIMLKHADEIADALGVRKVTTHHGQFAAGRGKDACQIDLVFLRTDKTITACEIKYSENPIVMTAELASQLRKQQAWLKMRFPRRRIESVIVTNTGVSSGVSASDLVCDVVTTGDLLG